MVATREKIAHSPNLSADYDRDADVLYIALGDPRPAEGEDSARGIVYRFAMDDNAPCGVTIIGFHRNNWDKNISAVAALVSKHLNVPNSIVTSLIEVSTT